MSNSLNVALELLEVPVRKMVDWLKREPQLEVTTPPVRNLDAVVQFPDAGIVAIDVTPPPTLKIKDGASADEIKRGNWIMMALTNRCNTLHNVLLVVAKRFRIHLEAENDSPLPQVSSLDLSSATGLHASTVRRLASSARIATPRGELALQDLVRTELTVPTAVLYEEANPADPRSRLVWVRSEDGRLYVIRDLGAVALKAGDRFVLDERLAPTGVEEIVAGAFDRYE